MLAGTWAMYYDRDWDAADRSFRRALALNPGNAMGHAPYAWFCTFMGRFDEAVAGIRRAVDLDPLMPMFGAFCVGILAEARRFDEAIAEFHSPVCIALLCWKLGNIDQALEYFEVALDERDTLVPVLNIYPFLDDLHRDPRFQAFLARLRFPAIT